MRSVCDDLSSLVPPNYTEDKVTVMEWKALELNFLKACVVFFLNEEVGVVLLNLYNLYYVLVEIDLCHHHPLFIWKQISIYNFISFKSQRPQHLIIVGEIYGHRYRVIW